MLNYIEWFSPMAKTFCNRPPVMQTVETFTGPRNAWSQEWKYSEGVRNTSDIVEMSAVGPPGEVKACTNFKLDSGNCVKYLELTFYQDCNFPPAPENVEHGSISGGTCIAYSFEHHTIRSGGDTTPVSKVPSWLWPYSVDDLYGQDSAGKSHCESESNQSVNYKDWFSGMAKTFCKSPPKPTTNETDNSNRTIWQQDWSYGTVGTGNTSIVKIVAIKSGAAACVNFEFSLGNYEKYLDDQLHLDCHLPNDPGSLISGSISGGACIAYSIQLSTIEGKIGLPALFKPADWLLSLWPFPIPIKKPGDQMTAHEFVVSYDWDCDVDFDKLSSTPNCHAHWGLWTRWSQDDLMSCDSLLDTNEKRFKLLSEDAVLPSAQTDSPLHIGDFAGLPLDTNKTVELAFEGDCLSKCRFNLGTKDDFSDSDRTCDVDDTCSKTKRFGCFAAPKNLIIDCPEKQPATGDRRF